MEEEKAVAYYNDLLRTGRNAALFKQGLGFGSNPSDAPGAKLGMINFVGAGKSVEAANVLAESRPLSKQDESSCKSQPRNLLKGDQEYSRTKSRSRSAESRQRERRDSKDQSRSRSKERRGRDRSRSRRLSRNPLERNKLRNRSSSRDRRRSPSRERRPRHRSITSDKSRSPSRGRRRDRSSSRSRSTRRRRRHSRDRSTSPLRKRNRRDRSDSKDCARSHSRGRSRRYRSHSRGRSRSRSKERGQRHRGDRQNRSRSRSRETCRQRRKCSRSRSREKSRRDWSRSPSFEKRGRYRDLHISKDRSSTGYAKSSRRNEGKTTRGSTRKAEREQDWAKLIPDFDSMTPAEKVKAKMKLQLSQTVIKDVGKGVTEEWERFDFNKDAPLDGDAKQDYFGDGTGASNDTALFSDIGSSHILITEQAKREARLQAAHEAAIFGVPGTVEKEDTKRRSSPRVPESHNTRRSAYEDEGGNHNTTAKVSGVVSDEVIALQSGVSWQERIKKMRAAQAQGTPLAVLTEGSISRRIYDRVIDDHQVEIKTWRNFVGQL